MTPREFEEAVAALLRSEGYETELGAYVGDWGVDVVATRGDERLAVQVKMYGGTSRPVNRQMVMELHGAAAYLDCTGAVIATDGRILPDAADVAAKLGIRVLDMGGVVVEAHELGTSGPSLVGAPNRDLEFEQIWERYVMPLQGRTLARPDGTSNVIEKVDWSGVERITSNGRRGRIKIEIFRFAIDRIIAAGSITRTEINDNYVGRASSGVILILSQVPLFQLQESPLTLRLRAV
jgi:hypothetical protein